MLTFPQWRTQVRLRLALRLLAEGLPVTTVGHRCGWSTTSAFIDVFRRALGHTPGQSPRTRDLGPAHLRLASPRAYRHLTAVTRGQH